MCWPAEAPKSLNGSRAVWSYAVEASQRICRMEPDASSSIVAKYARAAVLIIVEM
jgi:hypothetical protein